MVSIVVPIYNMEDSIERCVQSLILQDYPKMEILLVDDGSTDGTYNKCKELSIKDSRIKVFHTENRGSGPARNYGIEVSSGDYLYFPDADDVLDAKAIARLVEATDEGKNDIVVFGYESINQSGKIVFRKTYKPSIQNGNTIRNDYSEYMLQDNKWAIQGAPWNKFFSAEIVKKYAIEYPSLRRHQDEGFIGRYMCFANKICFIPDVLYTHYTNDLKLEWQKYPVNYYESVIGLYNDRKHTILLWNKEDKKTRDIITNSFICNLIKALELSFSPKCNFTKREAYSFIMNIIGISGISNVEINEILGNYQKIILLLIKNKQYLIMMWLMRLKVFIEKKQILDKFR